MKKVMKVLVSIPNYGDGQLAYLNRVVEEFRRYDSSYAVDIIIHSNIPIPKCKAEVRIIEHLDDWWELPFIARKTIVEQKSHYDLFVYNENDHLITQKNIESFLECSRFVPSGFLVGFFQYENGNGTKYYPAYHKPYTWKKNSVMCCGSYVFAQHTNCHQASFVVTRDQLAVVLRNLDFSKDNKLSKYNQAERVGTDIYYAAGFTKLICISHFDDFLIHHLPDKYLDFGISDEIIRKEITGLIGQKIFLQGVKGTLYCISASLERIYNRLFFQNGILGKIRRECYTAIKNIRSFFSIFQ